MKVKVNGVWKDHVAFLKKEKVGDLKVLEGEITLASEAKNLSISHNESGEIVYCFVICENFESLQQNDKTFGGIINNIVEIDKESRTPIYWSASGAVTCAATLQDSGIGITDGKVTFACSASRYFIAGTYRYKLYFKI